MNKLVLFGMLGLLIMPLGFSALTTNLKSYFVFNESSGDLIDNYGNFNGANTGVGYQATGKNGYGYTYNNNDRSTNKTAFTYNSTAMTFSFWIKPVSVTADEKIWDRAYDGGYSSVSIGFKTGSKLYCEIGKGSPANGFVTCNSPDTINAGAWNNIIVSYNVTSQKVTSWINCNKTEVSGLTTLGTAMGGYSIGNLQTPSTSYDYDGVMDEVAVWTRQLTDSEVAQICAGTEGSFYPFTTTIDYNLTAIYDNSTNHFVKFNTSVALNFTGYNVSGLTPQNLIVNITSLGLSQNFTSNVASNITFNNVSIYNYTVLVYDPFNTSVNYTAYFITSAYNLTSLTYNSSVANNSYTNYSVNVTELHDVEQNMNVSLTLNGTTYYLDSDELFYNNKYWSSSKTFTTIPLWVNMSLTYGGETLQYYLNYNQNIVSVNVDDCSVYTHQLINITVRDEQDRDTILVNTTLFTVFNVSGALFPITVTEDANGIIGICLNESVNFTANVDFSFTREGWGATDKINREHFYFNQYFNNSVIQQSFYKLENDTASKIIFNVYDSANLPLGNYYIELKRWYGNTYETVAMAKTGENGQAITYVEYNNYAYYSAVIRDSTGDVVYTTDRQIFTSTPTTIVVLDEVYETYYDLFNGFSYTENFNTTTNYFTTSITHIEGSDVLFDLDVYYFNGTSICNSLTSTSSISFNCLLNDWINETYIVTAKAYVDDQTINIYNVIIDERIFDIILDDEDGLLIGFFISLLMCVLLLSINKNYAIIGLPLGLTVSNMLLLTNINIGVIIGLFVSCVAIIFGFLRGER